jgi:hypothetical protein
VRRALICTLAVAPALTPVAVARATVTPAPTPSQIARAVHNATPTRLLWATVNVCVRRRRGGVMGVRGELPALGFDSTLSMTVQLRQYETSASRFVWVRGATAQRTVTLGTVRTGVHQDGVEFPYASDTGELDAIVTFTWTRAGRRLAEVTLVTTGGHPTAAFSQPNGHTAAGCRL